MAYSIAQYDALKNALALGVKLVIYSSAPGVIQRTEYASLQEMQAILQIMERELFPTIKTKKIYYTSYDRRY